MSFYFFFVSVRIKELENELARASSNLGIEKDRVAALEVSRSFTHVLRPMLADNF